MADHQLALLSKAVLDKDFVTLVNNRITEEYFADEKYARLFRHMREHWNRYGTSPDEDVMHADFPSQSWTEHTQPIDYFIQQLRQARKRSILLTALSAAAEQVQAEDPDSVDNIEQILQDGLVTARLETSPTYDVDFTTNSKEIELLLDDRADNPGRLRGISTGFKGIDYVTGGFQPEQFITLLGAPKSLKSALLLYMAISVHRQGKSAMFMGFEMSNMEQHDRTLSILSGVSLTKIQTGRYSIKERRAISRALSTLEDMRPFIFSSDKTSGTTVSGVQAKAQQYQPDVIFVDGMYLMQSELAGVQQESPQALTNISRSLKRLAQNGKITVVGTTQASLVRSQKGLGIGSGAYTQAWAQDSDVLLGSERQASDRTNDDSAPAIVKFRVIASRSGPLKDTWIEWDWNNGSVVELDPQKFDRKKAGSWDDEDD